MADLHHDPIIAAIQILGTWAIEHDVVIHAVTHFRSKFEGKVRHHATAMAIDYAGVVHHHCVTSVLGKDER